MSGFVVFRKILRSDGIPGVFRGFGTSAVGALPGRILALTSLEMSKEMAFKYSEHFDMSDASRIAVANGVAGLVSSIFSSSYSVPLDVVCQRLMVQGLPGMQTYRGPFDVINKVSPTLNPNKSHDDDVDDNEDEDKDEESDDIASLKIKGEMIFKSLYKNKLACSNFMEIMSIATEGKKYIEELEAHLDLHEATIERMEGHERDYANEIAELSQSLENEQTTKESLEETLLSNYLD
ncbi:Solute carrier family 25 member 44 [Hordeum vulgare]|nr:Solute carrier family 25 member 44 [Hordeum vulgare]